MWSVSKAGPGFQLWGWTDSGEQELPPGPGAQRAQEKAELTVLGSRRTI